MLKQTPFAKWSDLRLLPWAHHTKGALLSEHRLMHWPNFIVLHWAQHTIEWERFWLNHYYPTHNFLFKFDCEPYMVISLLSRFCIHSFGICHNMSSYTRTTLYYEWLNQNYYIGKWAYYIGHCIFTFTIQHHLMLEVDGLLGLSCER